MGKDGIKQDGLSRRSFLKGAAIAGAGAAAGAVLAGCSPRQSGESQTGSMSEGQTPQSWSTPPEQIDDTQISETLSCDVLVVGGGNAGQFAAAAAAEEGSKVILIEKLSSIGSTGRGWIGAVGSRYQKEAGIEIDVNEIVETLCFYASHRCNQRLVRLWADHSGEVVDWLGDVVQQYDPTYKIHFETDTGNPDHGIYKTYAIQHNVQNDEEYTDSLFFVEQKLKDLGVDIRTDYPMVQLIREESNSGRVIGVIAEDASSGNYVRIDATQGVILCTGGYGTNEEMMRELNPMAVRACVATEVAGVMNYVTESKQQNG